MRRSRRAGASLRILRRTDCEPPLRRGLFAFSALSLKGIHFGVGSCIGLRCGSFRRGGLLPAFPQGAHSDRERPEWDVLYSRTVRILPRAGAAEACGPGLCSTARDASVLPGVKYREGPWGPSQYFVRQGSTNAFLFGRSPCKRRPGHRPDGRPSPSCFLLLMQ